MSLTDWIIGMREKRLRKKFAVLGDGARFLGLQTEVKGRVEAGSGCCFGNNLVFRTHKGGVIVLGDNVEIGDYALLLSNSNLHIGNGVFIGPHCVLRDTNHLFQGTDVHWRLTPHVTEPITVCDNAYIGGRTYVMPGVTIGADAVIGPASVVTKDVPPGEMWAGSPARLIAHRTDPSKRAKFKRDLELAALFGLDTAAEDNAGGQE
ncbi:MAG TPA: acyltransferase [Candidatus Hydrogenedentes bacterium]|nr:acyltransferase [Candidatus Hydrogenedentota bacterium]HOC73255.1 acyltransferase [Candidatus Hydrogenedentota bacterium]HOH50119.1 acyltransferase [Candidatus Hydrogenedentota bacterium]HPA42008.1 acyltransferase [Candidatus Hydrogenedentota bacterium]HRZ82767.1 acyltransferase [Candidatus Hydrogenedentota bacterium]